MQTIGRLVTGARNLAYLILGAYILLLCTPLDAPYFMRHVKIAHKTDRAVTILAAESGGSWSPLSALTPIHTDTAHIYLATLLSFLILFTAHGSLRAIVTYGIRKVKKDLPALIVLAGFLLTLLPGNDGQLVIVYLLMATLGFCLIFLALFSLWHGSQNRNFCISAVHGLWNVFRRLLELRKGYFLGLLAVLSLLLTNLAALMLFDHLPHVSDSAAMYFHAKIFALGKVKMAAPVLPEFFGARNMILDGGWYSQYPPGHSLLLLAGFLLGLPWIINPVFCALTIIAVYYLGIEIYSEKTARLAALLTFFSPFIFFMSTEYMSHTTTLFFLTVFLWAFIKMQKSGRSRYALLTGMSLGMAFLIRPYSAVAVALPAGVYFLIVWLQNLKKHLLHMAAIGITFLFFVVAFLLFNTATTGRPQTTGYIKLHGQSHYPGLRNKGTWARHTMSDAIQQTCNNLNAAHKYLLEWPFPALLFMCLPLLSKKRGVWDWLLWSSFWSLVLFYFFYWYQDWCFGPRFLFEASMAMILLTAAGLVKLPQLCRSIWPTLPKTEIHGKLTVFFLTMVLVMVLVNIPALAKFYGHDYWGVSSSIVRHVQQADLKNTVLFVNHYFPSFFALNDPHLQGTIVYAQDLRSENANLMRLYPQRNYYLLKDGEIEQIFLPDKE